MNSSGDTPQGAPDTAALHWSSRVSGILPCFSPPMYPVQVCRAVLRVSSRQTCLLWGQGTCRPSSAPFSHT